MLPPPFEHMVPHEKDSSETQEPAMAYLARPIAHPGSLSLGERKGALLTKFTPIRASW